MRAVTWLIVSALSGIACGADPIRVPVTPSQFTPSPGPAFVPTPTYLVRVFVLTMTSPCSGCLVEITNGPGAGLAATTVRGEATFGNLEPGAVTVRASRDKYRPATITLMVDGPRTTIGGTVFLEPAVPTIDFTGARLLEVRADATCNQLPAEFRVRTYRVSLVRSNPGRFQAEPLDNVFKEFTVSVFGLVDEAAFAVADLDLELPGIVEELPDRATLRMDLYSFPVPVANRDAVSTPIEGSIAYCDASAKCTAVCNSKAHQLTLTRR
jgi:hypothetical protein